jgi:hypothetical protein
MKIPDVKKDLLLGKLDKVLNEIATTHRYQRALTA